VRVGTLRCVVGNSVPGIELNLLLDNELSH
jgi:hypothetical protein